MRNQSGSSVIETLIVFPVLIALMVGIFEICIFFSSQFLVGHLAHETLICLEDQGRFSSCLVQMNQRMKKLARWVQLEKTQLRTFPSHFEILIQFKRGPFDFQKTYRSQKF